MLCIGRKTGEGIQIDDKTTVTVGRIYGANVQLCIEAPREVRIVRTELLTDPKRCKEWEQK